MSQERLAKLGGHARQHWRRVTLMALGGVIGILIVVQFVFPWGAMPLYKTIDGVDVSGWNASDAQRVLDSKYKELKLGIYFGKSPKVYREPATGDVGVVMTSKEQVAAAQYSWWLRLVPTSLWWAHSVTASKSPSYTYDHAKAKAYVTKELGESCNVMAVNATLELKDMQLRVIPAIDGGTCELLNVEKKLREITPTLSNHEVRIAMVERPAKIHASQASDFADKLMGQIKDGIAIEAAGQRVVAPRSDVLSWLDFTAPDTGIVAKVNHERSKLFLEKELMPKVVIAPGTSRVATLDFAKVSEIVGTSGRTLDAEATLASFDAWLANPGNKPVAVTKAVAPNVAYTRSYTPTDTGLNALITQFAESHPGTFGVSYAELDGKRRHASYQSDKIFRTASTYKLFVAYGALKRVESGAWRMTDQIHGGRNLSKCLDDMIVRSDNPCGEVMLEKIGYKTLTNELRSIGLAKSTFTNSVPETTAGDLTIFNGALQSGQLLNPANTATLLSAMKRNVYRQGVPAGANGQVANKVGFLDNYLHDAAIVYGSSGNYVLSVMTEGSSWGVIAELTREIEKLRAQG